MLLCLSHRLMHHLAYLQAAWHGKPIVGLPLMLEQPDNVARAEEQVR